MTDWGRYLRDVFGIFPIFFGLRDGAPITALSRAVPITFYAPPSTQHPTCFAEGTKFAWPLSIRPVIEQGV